MKSYTLEEKLHIYRKTLGLLLISNKIKENNTLCYAISEAADLSMGKVITDMDITFPEVWKYKPEHITSYLDVWWDVSDIHSRICVMKQVIKDCEEQMVIEDMEIDLRLGGITISSIVAAVICGIILFILLLFKSKFWFIPAFAIIFFIFRFGYGVYRINQRD